MKADKNKKGQMKLSFGMIFSIFLIIVFIAFAFFAIKKFLGVQEEIKTGQFIKDLQNDIDTMWKSSQGAIQKEYPTPKGVGKICFIDSEAQKRGEDSSIYDEISVYSFGEGNMVFYPTNSVSQASAQIDHVDIERTTQNNNPLCKDVENQKIKIFLRKEFGEALVTLG